MKYFIGIDIGTQGARVALLDDKGRIVSEKEQSFLLNESSREEQSPIKWWGITMSIMEELVSEVKREIDIFDINSLAVTSTSGTVIPLDKQDKPLHNALMYSDKRSADVAPACESAAKRFFGTKQAYTGFNASSGLCKIVWYIKHFPEKTSLINKWVHAADYITGKLSGRYDISDETNVLKSGYDIFSESWPEYLFNELDLKKKWLPEVVPAGTPIGKLSSQLASKLGLHREIVIVAGMTDGCASQIASGAVNVGDWNTTLGTTMVVKGVTEKPIFDPKGRLYNHRHPEGYFMPGGAGNTGADWVNLEFKNHLKELTQRAKERIPSGNISWPLRTKGERFPIKAPQARGFEPEELSQQEQFVANMEGVAYLERYAFEIIKDLSGEKIKAIYTAGGGSKSDVWLKIRSNVLNLPIYKMKYISGAVGAAILAASKTHFNSLKEATESLTQIEKVIRPDDDLSTKYQKFYQDFLKTLKEKKYIE